VDALITLDTGALIALHGRGQRILKVFAGARERRIRIYVPSMAIAEWWRKRSDRADAMLSAFYIEHTDTALVKLAGEAVAATKGAGIVDAVVMATAARHGGVVYTSDVDDLTSLAHFFPSVRVLHC
jgi:predicted nucleic acid-binding protein